MPAWKKGQSGNAKGRPPKSRTLSSILAKKAEDIIRYQDGSVRAHQEVIADLLWEFATTGKVDLPSGTLVAENVNDWLNAVRWIYTHIDGPATLNPTPDSVTITIERIPTALNHET